MSKVNRAFGLVERLWAKKWLSPIKTVYFNFRLLPFRKAVRLPIHIYGPVKFCNLSGKVEIRGRVFSGMIKLGVQQGSFTACKRAALILISENAKIVFDGPCAFDYDYVLRISGNGILEIGAYTGFGNDIKICCDSHIKIGSYCRIAFGTSFMDSNYHYTINMDTKAIYRKESPITIGDFNWIGNRCTFMKGARTADHTIIGSLSFLNKDYTCHMENASSVVLAGAPASIVGTNMRRVFDFQCESKITEWFSSHTEKKYTVDDEFAAKCVDTSGYSKWFE